MAVSWLHQPWIQRYSRSKQPQAQCRAGSVLWTCAVCAAPTSGCHAVTPILLNSSSDRACLMPAGALPPGHDPLLMVGCRLVWPAGLAASFVLIAC